MNCSKCGAPLSGSDAFCESCKNINTAADKAARAEDFDMAQGSSHPMKTKKWHKRPWVYIAAFVVAAVIAAVILAGGVAEAAAAVFGPPDVIIIFDDKNLENAVRIQLDILDKDITEKDTTGVTVLALDEIDIADIGALASFTDLKQLSLKGNRISDIDALASLEDIEKLELSDNQISDLGALSGLRSLVELSLQNNLISDIAPLSALSRLESLCLGSNQIADLAPLGSLSALKILKLPDNQISSISPLGGCACLTELMLKNNPINDIGVAAQLVALEYINLEQTAVDDISSIAGRVKIDFGKMQDLKLMLDLGEYFFLENLTMPVNTGSAKINWTSSDQDVVTVSDGKVQATCVQDDAWFEFNENCTVEGKVENADIVFILDITVSHCAHDFETAEKKVKYKTGNYKITGYCFELQPKIEYATGIDMEYEINVKKGKINNFSARIYINEDKWKNFGSISVQEGEKGNLHIDFDDTVTITKYWIVATDKKSGQWRDFSYISKIYFACREANLDAALQPTGMAPPEAL